MADITAKQNIWVIFSVNTVLIKNRLLVELKWLVKLSETDGIEEVSQLSQKDIDWVMSIYDNFTPAEAQKVKDIEATTNHDVKAVEYYIKRKIGCA